MMVSQILAKCPTGYLEKQGDIPGWGSYLGSALNLTQHQCMEKCDLEDFCLSFEHGSSQMRCNLNELADPTQGPYEDYVFCMKNGKHATSKLLKRLPQIMYEE